MLVYVCLCVYMCVCVWGGVHACADVEARGQCWVFFILSSFFPESESLAEPGLHQFGQCTPEFSYLHLLSAGFAGITAPSFQKCLFVFAGCVCLSVCSHITYVHMTYGGQKSVTSPGTGVTGGYE